MDGLNYFNSVWIRSYYYKVLFLAFYIHLTFYQNINLYNNSSFEKLFFNQLSSLITFCSWRHLKMSLKIIISCEDTLLLVMGVERGNETSCH